jgi:hypothetical protein
MKNCNDAPLGLGMQNASSKRRPKETEVLAFFGLSLDESSLSFPVCGRFPKTIKVQRATRSQKNGRRMQTEEKK